MSNKVVLVGLWFALSLTAAISQDVKGQTSQGTAVSTTTTTATEQTTPNLITSGTTHTWTGVTTGALPASYMPGGPTPIYDPATNTVTFSYNANATVAQSIAINNALANAGAGVKINGYNYSYDVRNMNGDNRQGGTDTLNVYQNLVSTTGASLLSSQQTYNTKFEWQSVAGTRVAPTPIDMANASYLKFSMTGGDNGYWGGYFGPSVRNVNMSLNYTVDQCSVNPQSSPSCPGFKTFYNISDDGYAQVNLPFVFPFYGRNFTTSYFFSNGVVGFLDPNTHGNGFCCDGINLASNPGSSWNFAIYALQTDLIAANPNAKFYTQSDPTYMKYTWENVNEYGTQNLNTFSATIRPTGYIGIKHDAINVQYHNVTTGIAGDIAQGQYSQYYTGPGSIFPYTTGNTITFTGTEVADRCVSDPLSSPTCPLYTATMCSTNVFFSDTCQGYTEAVNQCLLNPFTTSLSCPNLQQATAECNDNQLNYSYCPSYSQALTICSTDPLSNTLCPTYQLTRQCNLNQLYSQSCTGYQTTLQACTTNPLGNALCPTYTESLAQCTSNSLYASYCPGYTTASQACTTNPLSNTLCTGYGMATLDCEDNPLSHSYCPTYAATTIQCTANTLSHSYCPGYATAYFNQQCSLDGLYDRTCPNYATAYKAQQCSLNALFATDCPGYAVAYFNQQCSLNALYDRTCPGYNEAYAKKMLLEQQGIASTVATAGVVAATAPKETTTTTSSTSTSDGSSSVAVAVVADPIVNQAVTSTATSTSPAAAATATVSLAPAPAPAQAAAEQKPEPKNEPKPEGGQGGQQAGGPQPQGGPSGEQPKPTARQELAAKREAAAKAEAVEKGKNLAKEMGKVADMESQKQAQNVVIQAMGFTPGFDAYGKTVIPDVAGYKPFTVYNNQKNVDNKRLGWGLYGPSDRLHNDLVDSQYNIGN